jgi:hypothetical protein
MGSHSNVSFEPVSSVFIGSVHDRMTEVVALGSGGLICCGFSCLLVCRRLHRRSYAILMDKGTLKKDVCKCCSNQSRRSKRKTLLFANKKLSTINECEEALPAHHGSSSTRPTGALCVAYRLYDGGERALESAYRSTALTSRTSLTPSDDEDDDGGVSFARGSRVTGTTWHKAHRRQVPAEALRSILGCMTRPRPLLHDSMRGHREASARAFGRADASDIPVQLKVSQ